jgi:nitroreductase
MTVDPAHSDNPVLAAILSRRSLSPRRLALPAPSPDALKLILRASAAAPDHKKLRPFRFILIPDHKRADLANAFRAAKLARDPNSTEEDLERAAGKAHNGPMLLAVVIRTIRDDPRVSVLDQLICAGAAVENVLLAAQALGFGGCLRSGTSATSRTVREALQLDGSEDLAAFIILGTPQKQSAPPRDDDIAGLLTTWE